MSNVIDIKAARQKTRKPENNEPKRLAGYIYSSEADMEQARILLNVAGDKRPTGADLASVTAQITQTRILRAILENQQGFSSSDLGLSKIVYTGS